MKSFFFIKEPQKKVRIYRLLLMFISFIVTSWLVLYQFDIVLAILLSIVLSILDFLFLCNKEFIYKTDKKIYYVMLPVSFAMGFFIYECMGDLFFSDLTGIMKKVLFCLSVLKSYIALIVIVPWIISAYIKNQNLKMSLHTLGAIFSFFFFLWIFIPSSVFFANKAEFAISYWNYIIPLYITLFISTAIIYTLVLPASKKDINNAGIFFSFILIGSYLQYLFFNGDIGELDGSKYYWNHNVIISFIDVFIWLIVAVLFFSAIKKHKDITVYYVSYIILGIQLITIVIIIATAPADSFVTEVAIASGEKQYSLAKKQNTVVFVLDAVDNSFIKAIYEDSPESFDDLRDFTLYTDTCSVFDFTSLSMPQMFTGSTYNSCEVDYVEFYNRLHENDYKVLFFNYDEDNTVIYNIKPFLDNYYANESTQCNIYIDYSKIITSTFRYSLLNMCPNILKGYLKQETISFNQIALVSLGDEGSNMYYNNDDFYNHMVLSIDEDMTNAFIMQHINGAHLPCDDFIVETEYCLNIVSDYINQMKELGVYDESTIIITSDHGVHDRGNVPYPTAATPIFLIKSPGVYKENIDFNDSPIYHTDFLATILINAGLYNDVFDYGKFGNSIYDFEGKKRERTWYNRNFDTKSGLCAYTYIGDTNELVRKVENDEYSLAIY